MAGETGPGIHNKQSVSEGGRIMMSFCSSDYARYPDAARQKWNVDAGSARSQSPAGGRQWQPGLSMVGTCSGGPGRPGPLQGQRALLGQRGWPFAPCPPTHRAVPYSALLPARPFVHACGPTALLSATKTQLAASLPTTGSQAGRGGSVA